MISAGSVIIDSYSGVNSKFFKTQKACALAAGSMCIINGLIYAVDTFFAYQNYSG